MRESFNRVVDVLSDAIFSKVPLFACSTLVAWGFYGLQAWGFLFGHGPKAQWSDMILYVLVLPPAAVMDLGRVVDIVDSAFFPMAIPNVIAPYLCAGELRRDVRGYRERIKSR